MAEKSNPSAAERDRQSTQTPSSDEAEASAGKGGDLSGAATEAAEGAAKHETSSSGQSGGTSRRSRGPQEHVSLKGIGSLERLRDRVETAAHELKRLREENQALSERVRELESRPEVEVQGTFLSLEHDPELLRRKITGFIEAIDRYLENERQRS